MPDKRGREHEYNEAGKRASKGDAGSRPPARLSAEDEEQLSAYLDNALGAPERASLERRLRSDAGLAQALRELRAMRSLLRALPQPTPPRSFLLPEDDDNMAPPTRSVRQAPGRGARGAAPLWSRVVTWSGGLAAVLGIALFLGLLMSGGVVSHSSSAGSATYAPNSHNATTAGSTTTQARPNGTLQSAHTTPVTTGKTPTTPNVNDHASTPTAAVTTAPTHIPQAGSANNAPSSSPLSLPTIAILLVIAGLLLVIIGRLGARMRR